MIKISNKLILASAILAFIFGLSIVSPAYAASGFVSSGISFNPDPITAIQQTNKTINTTTVINRKIINNNSVDNNSNTSDTNAAQAQTNTAPNTVSDINPSYSSLTATALLGSNTFMPSGLVQWIILIIIILAIIILWRYVHRSEEKYMSEPMKHA